MTEDDLRQRIMRLESDNREIATALIKSREELQQLDESKRTIKRLQSTIEYYEKRESDRRKRIIDRKKTKMLEGLS